MRVLRRIYFYLVALISLEVVVWGVVSLLWYTVLRRPEIGSSYLARGLSLVLVGLPIFLLHWMVAQRDAARDEDERWSRIRALFLYMVRLIALVTVTWNVLAMTNRASLLLLGQDTSGAFVGGEESWSDNLMVIAVNLTAWAYFIRILRRDWQEGGRKPVLVETRRLSRYIWMLIGLSLTVAGVWQVLSFLLYAPQKLLGLLSTALGNGLSLVIVGVPLWIYSWGIIQRSLADDEELFSGLRLGVLYLLSLAAAVTTLAASGFVLSSALNWLLGNATSLPAFMAENNTPLTCAVVFGVLWAYYGGILQRELSIEPDPLRRAELWRPYFYILSLLGNSAVFIGLWILLRTILHLLLGENTTFTGERFSIAASTATLLVGLPVWLRHWQTAQGEARRLDTLGDHARRSAIRKGYLYLAVFATVISAMVTAGLLFFLTLNTLIGNHSPEFWLQFAWHLQGFLLTAVWLAYYISTLMQDGKQAQQALGEQHSSFPAVIFLKRGDEALGTEIEAALQKRAPRLPLKVHFIEDGLPDEDSPPAGVCGLPAALALNPPPDLRTWLEQHSCQRLLIANRAPGWLIPGSDPERSLRDLAQDTAQNICRLAEKQSIRSAAPSALVIAAYVLAGVFGLLVLMMVMGSILTVIMG